MKSYPHLLWPHRHGGFVSATAILLGAVLSACGAQPTTSSPPPASPRASVPEPAPAPPPVAPPPEIRRPDIAKEPGLFGTWDLVAIDGKPPTTGRRGISVVFGRHRGIDHVGGSAGCNAYSGNVRIDERRRTLALGSITSTSMACLAPGVMQQESSYLALLGGVRTYSRSTDRLRLTTATGQHLDFRLRQPPRDRQLAGTPWTLQTVIEHGTAASPIAGMRVTMTVNGDVARIDTSCNKLEARFDPKAASPVQNVRFVGVATPCRDALARAREQTIVRLLGQVRQIEIKGPILRLRTPGGEGIDFRAP